MLKKVQPRIFRKDDIVKFQIQSGVYVGEVLGTVTKTPAGRPVKYYEIRLCEDQPPFTIDGVSVVATGTVLIPVRKAQEPLYFVSEIQVYEEGLAIRTFLEGGWKLASLTVAEVRGVVWEKCDRIEMMQDFDRMTWTDRLHYNGCLYQEVPDCCAGCEYLCKLSDNSAYRCSWGWGRIHDPPEKPAHCTVPGSAPPIRFPGTPVWEVPAFCHLDEGCGQTGLCQYGAHGEGVPCAALKRWQEGQW